MKKTFIGILIMVLVSLVGCAPNDNNFSIIESDDDIDAKDIEPEGDDFVDENDDLNNQHIEDTNDNGDVDDDIDDKPLEESQWIVDKNHKEMLLNAGFSAEILTTGSIAVSKDEEVEIPFAFTNMDESVAEIQLKAISLNGYMIDIEEQVFTAAVNEKVEAVLFVDQTVLAKHGISEVYVVDFLFYQLDENGVRCSNYIDLHWSASCKDEELYKKQWYDTTSWMADVRLRTTPEEFSVDEQFDIRFLSEIGVTTDGQYRELIYEVENIGDNVIAVGLDGLTINHVEVEREGYAYELILPNNRALIKVVLYDELYLEAIDQLEDSPEESDFYEMKWKVFDYKDEYIGELAKIDCEVMWWN